MSLLDLVSVQRVVEPIFEVVDGSRSKEEKDEERVGRKEEQEA